MTSLVVKKASKARLRTSGSMPAPVSATVKRTPVWSGSFQCTGAAGADQEAASVCGSVDGVADQVGEDLADFTGKAEQVQLGVVVALDLHVEGIEAALIEAEDGVEQLRHFGAGRQCGLAVEAEGLLGDLGDAADLVFGHGDVIEGRIVEFAVIAQEEEQVGDGFERVVDFVGDGSGQAAGNGEFFSLAQGLFAAFAVAGVEDDDAGPANLLGCGAHRVGADQPGPWAAGLAGLAAELKLRIGSCSAKTRSTAFSRCWAAGCGNNSGRVRPRWRLSGDAGEVGKDLVDAGKPAVAVKEGQADGRIGEHGVEQREGVVEAGALLGDGGDHAVEGLNQVADFVLYAGGQREVAAVFRRGHQGAGAAMQNGERAGDGTGHQQDEQGRGQDPDDGEDGGVAEDGRELFAGPALVELDPGKAAQVGVGVDGCDALPAVAGEDEELGSSAADKGNLRELCRLELVWSASPLLTKSTLPAGSVTLATATVGASPIILTERPTQPGRFWSRASLACKATEEAS